MSLLLSAQAQATDEDCGAAGAGSCYESNGSPGCSNSACCRVVCEIDSFCCTNEWDEICANQALELCGMCGTPGAGYCIESNGSPGCDDSECCETICVADPFCCDTEWDSVCADMAALTCGSCGAEAAGNCYAEHTTPSCENSACCDAVCEIDSFCCNTEWDDICAGIAAEACGMCGTAAAGTCFASNGNAGCDNAECCAAVCAIDPFCCDNNWDAQCAEEAAEICTTCGGEGSGDCFAASPTPSCNNGDCCQLVCSQDPFCCDTEWDNLCVDAANSLCAPCGTAKAGNCYAENGSAHCDDPECCLTVCAQDPFCCTNVWDDICVSEALELCGNCGSFNAGSCTETNGSPGCANLFCCAIVCELDPFCCNNNWDSTCATEAAVFCSFCPQDCVHGDTFLPPSDGIVNGADLAVLLGDWGPCAGCCSDTVNSAFDPIPDGVVDGADLGVLLTAWGSPGCMR